MDNLVLHLHVVARDVLAYITNIPAASYYTAGILVGSAIVSSGVVELFKRRYNVKHAEDLAKHYTVLLLGFVSVVLTAADSLLQFGTLYPQMFGKYTPTIIGLALLVYRFGGNATYKKIANSLNSWASKASQYKNETTPKPSTSVAVNEAQVSAIVPEVDAGSDPLL